MVLTLVFSRFAEFLPTASARAAPPKGSNGRGYPTSNLALSKVAWMSSLYDSVSFQPSSCVDGSSYPTLPGICHSSVPDTQSTTDTMPSLTVDLGATFGLSAVQIVNR